VCVLGLVYHVCACEANKCTGFPHSAAVNLSVMIGTTLLVGCPTFRLECGRGLVQHIHRAGCGYSGAKLLLSSCRATEYVQTMREFQFLERSHKRVYSN
jgi:hypothetical protein